MSGKGIGFTIALTIASIIIVGVISSYYILQSQNLTADAGGPYSVDEDHGPVDYTVELDGTRSSDPEGDSLSYHWRITSGLPYGSLTDSNSPICIFHAPTNVISPKNVTVQLTVDDGYNTDTDTTTVTVYPYNEPPEITTYTPSSTSPSVDEPADLTFSVDVSDEEDSSLSYSWGGDASGWGTSWIYYGSWDTNHSDEIVYVTCTVEDSGGKSDSVSWDLTVMDMNRSPIADAGGPYSVDEDHGLIEYTIELDGRGSSDPEGDNLGYEWRITSGSSYGSLTDNYTSTPTVHAPPEVSSPTYVTVELEINDGYGGVSTDTVTVTVNPYQELAHKYMPTLKHEAGEDYFTVDPTFDGDYDTSNNKDNYYKNNPIWVYIHRVDYGGKIYMQYWYYYVYNTYPIYPDHKNDWELLEVVLDSSDFSITIVKVRYGSHGNMHDYDPWWVEWEDNTHPVAYVAGGTHAMDHDTGCIAGTYCTDYFGDVGYVAKWEYFVKDSYQFTFFGDEDPFKSTSTKSWMDANGYRYWNKIEITSDGYWPANYDGTGKAPWNRDIWDNPTLGSYG